MEARPTAAIERVAAPLVESVHVGRPLMVLANQLAVPECYVAATDRASTSRQRGHQAFHSQQSQPATRATTLWPHFGHGWQRSRCSYHALRVNPRPQPRQVTRLAIGSTKLAWRNDVAHDLPVDQEDGCVLTAGRIEADLDVRSER